MIVRTISGAEYTIVNGRMTRKADVNPYCPPDRQKVEPIINEPVVLLSTLTPGQQLSFRIQATRSIYNTSLVREVEHSNGNIHTT
jgi:hypothetical protein